MRTWYTTKPNMATVRSQISHVVGDSTWEGHAANVFEKSGKVVSYVKNDHLGFQVSYMWNGSRRRFIPDFMVRLTNGKTLVRSEEHTSALQSLMRTSYAVFCLKTQ